MCGAWCGVRAHAGDGDGALDMDMEKKLIVVHRLHQILVPFMLRRQVRGGGRGATHACMSTCLLARQAAGGCPSVCGRGSPTWDALDLTGSSS